MPCIVPRFSGILASIIILISLTGCVLSTSNFRAQNDSLDDGYLMDKQKFEFWPNLCPQQLFKVGNRQGIVADFATPFFKPH